MKCDQWTIFYIKNYQQWQFEEVILWKIMLVELKAYINERFSIQGYSNFDKPNGGEKCKTHFSLYAIFGAKSIKKPGGTWSIAKNLHVSIAILFFQYAGGRSWLLNSKANCSCMAGLFRWWVSLPLLLTLFAVHLGNLEA